MLGNGKLRIVTGSAFQTVGVVRWKGRFASSVFISVDILIVSALIT